MKKNKFCVSRSFVFLSLILVVLIGLVILVNKLNNSNLTTTNKAAEPNLKAYFTIYQAGVWGQGWDFWGIDDPVYSGGVYNSSNKTTLLARYEYYVCIDNSSSNNDIKNNAYEIKTNQSDFKTKYLGLFSLSAPGSTKVVQGVYGHYSGCFAVMYDKTGTYQMNGTYRPYIYSQTLEGGRYRVIVPNLTIIVKSSTITPTPISNLKAHLNVLPRNSNNYIFLGLNNTSNQVTFTAGQQYYVWIENNSWDPDLAGPYINGISYCDSIFKTKYSNLFSLSAPGSSRLVQGEDDCMPHVFSVTYNNPGNYKINGVFRPYIFDPTIPGGQSDLYTPTLNVTVKTTVGSGS